MKRLKNKVVDVEFVLKDDEEDFLKQNKQAVSNSCRSQRDELLTKTDWTHIEDSPLYIYIYIYIYTYEGEIQNYS